MKVLNVHKRVINQPKEQIGKLLYTLATDNDEMLATDKWPRMKLKNGKSIGSKGGHGPIRYTVTDYQEGRRIEFEFTKPTGFQGHHFFSIEELGTNQTEIKHVIKMETKGLGTLKWLFAIRWLHDAFVEDALDKVCNHFTENQATASWSLWVKFLRKIVAT